MIDFNFIGDLEGNTLTAYVPDPRRSKSGVTIGSGFDLGARSWSEISGAFDNVLAGKLRVYLGTKSHEAVALLRGNPLTLSEDEVGLINEYSKKLATARLLRAWRRESTKVPFGDLSWECQTVIASVAFQYGDLSRKAPNFWKQVCASDWHSALRNLRNFGDRYPTRRNKEADLLASRIGH